MSGYAQDAPGARWPLLRKPFTREQLAEAVLLATAALVWVTMLVFGMAMGNAMASHATGSQFAVGWQNRALVLAWALWVAALAAHSRKPPLTRLSIDGHAPT